MHLFIYFLVNQPSLSPLSDAYKFFPSSLLLTHSPNPLTLVTKVTLIYMGAANIPKKQSSYLIYGPWHGAMPRCDCKKTHASKVHLGPLPSLSAVICLFVGLFINNSYTPPLGDMCPVLHRYTMQKDTQYEHNKYS